MDNAVVDTTKICDMELDIDEKRILSWLCTRNANINQMEAKFGFTAHKLRIIMQKFKDEKLVTQAESTKGQYWYTANPLRVQL